MDGPLFFDGAALGTEDNTAVINITKSNIALGAIGNDGRITFVGTGGYTYVDTATGTYHGNVAGTSTKATQDGAGNVIVDTYVMKKELSGIQGKLTFDSTPTANSTNPVTSDGVKKYVDSALASLISADDKSY